MANGPPRAQSKVMPSILRRFGHTLVVGDMVVSLKEYAVSVNQGGTADILFVLGKISIFAFLVRAIFVLRRKNYVIQTMAKLLSLREKCKIQNDKLD